MGNQKTSITRGNTVQKTKWDSIKRDIKMYKFIYIMLIPVMANFIIFHYIPMGGILIAFKKYNVAKGFFASPWVGLQNFRSFFNAHYFWRLLRNTLTISLYSILWGFPAPILLALFFNELRNERFKKTVQTVSYLPHFLSTVIVVAIIRTFFVDRRGNNK